MGTEWDGVGLGVGEVTGGPSQLGSVMAEMSGLGVRISASLLGGSDGQ